MGRIKLELPQQLPFEVILPVRITDLNYGAHLGNDSLLAMIHEARVHFFAHLNYSEVDFGGVSMIMADSAIVYKSEAFQGDQLNFAIGPGDVASKSFDLYYRIINTKNQELVAEAKTGLVCFDYDKRQPIAIPDSAKGKLENLMV